MRLRFVYALCFISLLIYPAQSAQGQDWAQWRGPARNGMVNGSSVPQLWPETFRRAWRIETGEGYSSPVVSGGRAFVHCRLDPDEIVMSIDLAKGTVVWQQKYTAPFQKNQYAVRMAKGPNSTPLVMGGRLFTLGVTGILTSWDAATGRKLWSKDFSKMIDTSKLFCGTAASPLAVGNLVVVQVGSDIHGGKVVALDPATGSEKWQWQGPGPGYASPVLIDIAGKPQIVTLTNSSIVGLDAKTGGELWSTPFPDEWHENIVTPVWTGSHLIVSGPRQGTHAYAIRQTGGKWQATEAWKNAEVTMYMSSPVYGDDSIYGLSIKRKGQLVALDEKTGAIRWASEGRDGEHASVLITPRHVLYLTNNANLIVARRGTPKLEIEKRYEVADTETWAVPVLLGKDVLVRDKTGLIRLTPGQ